MKHTPYAQGTPLRVFWVDSAHLPGWSYGSPELRVEAIVTLGYVVESRHDGLVLSTSIGHNLAYLAPLIVPWPSITHIQELPAEWQRDNNLPSS